MNYTKPIILKSEKAILAIQQVNQHDNPAKIPSSFLDLDFSACVQSAYAADE